MSKVNALRKNNPRTLGLTTVLLLGLLLSVSFAVPAAAQTAVQTPTESSWPMELIALGEKVLFNADDGVHGKELWVSDGTEDGTTLLWDGIPGSRGADPRGNVLFRGEAYFCGCLNTTSVCRKITGLWKTDGSPEGTVRLTSNRPFCGTEGMFAEYSDHLYFTAKDPASGVELWRTDGTPEGTEQVMDLEPGSEGAKPTQLFTHNNRLFFSAQVGERRYLFVSDGSREGTVPLAAVQGGYSGWHFAYASLGDTLYFTAEDGKIGGELWKSDGTPGGTVLVRDIHPGPKGSQIFSLTELKGHLYFSAYDGKDRELWRTDGTTAGTVSLNVNPKASSYPNHLALFGEHLYFGAVGDRKGFELWRVDGTPKGTVRVTDIQKGKKGASINLPVAFGSHLFFVAENSAHGMELWKTDGSTTVEVADIEPGPGSGRPRYPVQVGDKLFFTASDGVTGHELWVSDGTAEGTRRVRDINRQPLK